MEVNNRFTSKTNGELRDFVSFLQWFNFFLCFGLVALAVYAEVEITQDDYILSGILLFFTLPSLIYNFLPFFKRFDCFKWLAKTISSLAIGGMTLNIILYMLAEVQGFQVEILLAIFIVITGPCGLISITLLILINYDVEIEPEHSQILYYGKI